MDIGLLLVVILIVVFVWRGPRTLPQIGRTLGEGVRAIRREADRAGHGGTDEDGGSRPDSNEH